MPEAWVGIAPISGAERGTAGRSILTASNGKSGNSTPTAVRHKARQDGARLPGSCPAISAQCLSAALAISDITAP